MTAGIRRFDVWLVRLDPVQGSEMRKTRPAVVVSPDEMNAVLRTVIVCPLTSSRKNWPSRIQLQFDGKDGDIALDQIRSVDASRLARRLGSVDTETARAVRLRLQDMFAG